MTTRCSHHACEDFHRTSGSRRDGLYQSRLTRRQVLGAGLGFGLGIYTTRAMQFADVLQAATAHAASGPSDPILVSVFLPGGLDLLDTLVPLNKYGKYADLRPRLKVEGAKEIGSTGIGLNPALSTGLEGGIEGLYARGKVGFLPGIDYANPDLSHFQSRHFWETGLITPKAANGWLGRWIDRHGSPDNPLQALSLAYSLSPALRSSSAPVAAVSSPEDAQFWIPGVWGEAFDKAMAAWSDMANGASGKPGPQAAAAAARTAKAVGDQLKPYVPQEGAADPLAPVVEYPKESKVAERLSRLAGLLSLPLGVKIATVDVEGDFDTHDAQKTELPKILSDTCSALASFQADLEQRGLADRVLTFVWSEFGRRPQENESDGTDHGAGGLAWVQGNRARSGILTEYPDLSSFDREDNLKVTVDFRQVYSSLLEQWMGTDAGEVISNARSLKRVQLVS